jgi:hypothetical protein
LGELSPKWLRDLEIFFLFYGLNQIQNMIRCRTNST